MEEGEPSDGYPVSVNPLRGHHAVDLARARRLVTEAVELLDQLDRTVKFTQQDQQLRAIDREAREVDRAVRRALLDSGLAAQFARSRAQDAHVAVQQARNGAAQARNGGLRVGPELDRAEVLQLVHRLCGGLESRVTAGEWADDRERHLRTLDALAVARDSAQTRIDDLVPLARRAGASWAEIGRVLGLTRQAAHSRYRHRE